MSPKKKSQKIHLILAILLVIVSVVFVLGRYRSARPVLDAQPPGHLKGSGKGPIPPPGKMPSRKEQDEMRSDLINNLQLTSDQVEKLKKISKKYGPVGDVKNLGAILRELGKDMSPVQQQMAHNYIRKQMLVEMKRQNPSMTQEQLEKALQEFESQKPPKGMPGADRTESEKK